MTSDDVLVTQAMSASEKLSKAESDQLMEFLWQLRSGGELTSTQRAQLRLIAEKARARPGA